MNFQVSFSNSPVVIKLINAPSWSSCLAYCEGTGLVLNNISLYNGEIVINDNTTTNCYTVTLSSDTTNVYSFYQVFDENYNTLQTWINSQTGKTCVKEPEVVNVFALAELHLMYINLTCEDYCPRRKNFIAFTSGLDELR